MTDKYTRRLCRHCKQRFERLTSFVKKRNPRFCSLECWHAYQHGRKRYIVRGPKPKALCQQCGTEFDVTNRKNANRFCSRRCLYQWNRGSNAPNWKGGKFIDKSGYVMVRLPDHPRAKRFFGGGGYVREHIVVMEQELGRSLRKDETVHHINGDRSDNRPANLEIRNGHHGKGTVLMCADCGSHNIVHAAIGVARGEV